MVSKKKVKTKQKQKQKQKQSQTVIVNVSKITRAKPTMRQLQNKPTSSSPIFQPSFQPIFQPVIQPVIPSFQPAVSQTTYKLNEQPKPFKFESGTQTSEDLQFVKELAEKEYVALDKKVPPKDIPQPVERQLTAKPKYYEPEQPSVGEGPTFRQFIEPVEPVEPEVVAKPTKRQQLLESYKKVFGTDYTGSDSNNKLQALIKDERARLSSLKKFQEEEIKRQKQEQREEKERQKQQQRAEKERQKQDQPTRKKK